MRRLLLCLLLLPFLVSCVYLGAGRTDLIRKMGGDGAVVITADVERMRESGAFSSILDAAGDEVTERTERIAVELIPSRDEYPLPLDEWDVSALAFGRLSSTEVGTLLRWLPEYVHARDGAYYRAADGSAEIGIPEDGIVLLSTLSYGRAYEKIFAGDEEYIPASVSVRMEDALIGIYLRNPETLFPIGFDLPKETVEKIVSAFLLLNGDGEDGFLLSGEIAMESESSARTLQILLRNLLVQEIRRAGGTLDVRALSGIFTYEGAVVTIDGYPLSREKAESMFKE